MDVFQQHQRRRQGLEDSAALSQDMTRVAKRAGRVNARPRNVAIDAAGNRFFIGRDGPRNITSSLGRPAPGSPGERFMQSRARQSNIDAAKADGSFAQKRFDFNKANYGKYDMDDGGKIHRAAAPPSQPDATPPQPQSEAPAQAPSNPASPETAIDGQPTSRFFSPRLTGRIRDETGDRTEAITRAVASKPRLPAIRR